MSETHFGLTGLAVMGQNLARNVAHKGFPIAVHNRTTEKTETFLAEHGSEGQFTGSTSVEEFVNALTPPRAIMIMVKAGKPVDDVIAEIKPFLAKGDLLIDGGNSLFTDTERRVKELEAEGLRFLGTGVSGGEEGALNGPSIMPGGSQEAYAIVEPIFTKISAQVNGEPCCTFIGAGGAGHYVKMVHNGIEYADMQLIAEAYDLLKNGLGLTNEELHEVFTQWNAGDLDSFLIEITAQIFARKDDDSDGYLVDKVLDKAAQKGTGKWTSQSSLDLGIPVTAITEAVFARCLSSFKDQRVAASKILPGPTGGKIEGDRQQFIDDVRDALYASKVVAYAQGFDQMIAAAKEHGWTLNLGAIATIWRGGCIIRARFLDRIKEAYDAQPDLANLLLAPYFTEAVGNGQTGWRRVISEAARLGIPVPAFSSSLAYYDGYRRANLPANLIQAQRDLFGAHTYERTDKPGNFHSQWVE
ncbi:6-phosphogluconate dehydrogenase, decarboxylating [Capsulimonas corticalis]|uniref:6-phosphogluconate dehydrogenase, decarboxylating n=1 Tax=Capsulimonas corticalis TaxID=2219043 RepID=A0A402CS06_9BACT|nr:NADP-dependent phosphogluconate dehydrogenase [Capsulimonas corticalis]BDI28172.1 6-phosphogluconate dehydrogenase, decarboxylating [Capsulimonas corticalis]